MQVKQNLPQKKDLKNIVEILRGKDVEKTII